MKKFFTIFICFFSFSISCFATNNFLIIDSSTILEEQNDNYNFKYEINYEEEEINHELYSEIQILTKKTTYLLLGKPNTENESAQEYLKRKKEYLNLRYAPHIPEDPNSYLGLDENSVEYKDDMTSGIYVPQMFKIMSDFEIKYSKLGDISIKQVDNGIISRICIPNAKLKRANKDNPMKYDEIEVRLIIYYYYKELDGEYKLYYLMGEYDDDLSKYFDKIEAQENSGISAIYDPYNSSLNEIYDFSKLQTLTTEEINNIYSKNINQVVMLNTYYNDGIVNSASGFFLTNDVIVTTYNYVHKSLINGEKIIARDNENNVYNIDGIITMDENSGMALLKVSNSNKTGIILGNGKNLKTEDPVFTITSKGNIGLSMHSGIVIGNNNTIESLIPLNENDEGSPLINAYGEVIGINTSISINSSTSIAKYTINLQDLQENFSKNPSSDIEYISFADLKENYYIKNQEIISKNIKEKDWNEFSKIGDIQNSIKLDLIKAHYIDGIVSLRYLNNYSKYSSSMIFVKNFEQILVSQGYKNILTNSKKIIYENNNYRIIIMEEFDYLIVIMVKL